MCCSGDFDEVAVKIPAGEFLCPLESEFGIVDLSRFPPARDGNIVGIVKRADYDALGTQPASMPEDIRNYLDGTKAYASGRAYVADLEDHTPVVCYYTNGTNSGYVDSIRSERMAVLEDIEPANPWYFCIAAVDKSKKLAELSEPLQVTIRKESALA